jgi:hypothetical protein
MFQVSLDTSFLITFADPGRAHHAVALEYFRHCLTQRIPMWLSTVAAGEFEVKQPVSDLPLQNFRIQPYNLPHAIRAAALLRAVREDSASPVEDRRPIIINDLKILAQAEDDGIPVILTEDRNTLSRLTDRLRERGQVSVRVLLLSEGFTPGRIAAPAQDELRLPPSSAPS